MNIDKLESELSKLKEEKHSLLKLVNHDIRSPFNRIFALLQLLEIDGGDFSESQQEYIDNIYLSISSGLEMIRNLKDMRELDAGNIQVDKNEIDLKDVINKVIRSFSKQIELKKLIINIENNHDSTAIYSDEYYLQRLIENVLSNSVKFSNENTRIKIRLQVSEAELKIEIQDFASGINSDEEHMLFHKFKKLSGVPTGGEGALGLGLYNTWHLLEKMGGSIHLKRTGEPGSTFVIKVPAK